MNALISLGTSMQGAFERVKEAAPSVPDIRTSTAEAAHWFVQERGGLSKLVGMGLIPSQRESPKGDEANRIIEETSKRLPQGILGKIERIEIEENGIKIKGVILYPVDYVESSAKCVLYNNANAFTVSDLLEDGLDVFFPPYQILNNTKCPMILYDYRGTGLSAGSRPSTNTISLDGVAALNYAMRKFDSVEVWGSSLGGAVATIACETYMKEHPEEVARLSLFNHDSFRTIGKVASYKPLSYLATALGSNLDAETPMRSLAKRNVKIVILSHKLDPTIPQGARMSEIASQLGESVRVIESAEMGHVDLSADMLEKLGFNN